MYTDKCLDLIGAVIKKSIQDAKRGSTSAARVRQIEAMYFLFGDGILEDFLKSYGLEEILSPSFIRYQAKRKLCKTKLLSF